MKKLEDIVIDKNEYKLKLTCDRISGWKWESTLTEILSAKVIVKDWVNQFITTSLREWDISTTEKEVLILDKKCDKVCDEVNQLLCVKSIFNQLK